MTVAACMVGCRDLSDHPHAAAATAACASASACSSQGGGATWRLAVHTCVGMLWIHGTVDFLCPWLISLGCSSLEFACLQTHEGSRFVAGGTCCSNGAKPFVARRHDCCACATDETGVCRNGAIRRFQFYHFIRGSPQGTSNSSATRCIFPLKSTNLGRASVVHNAKDGLCGA